MKCSDYPKFKEMFRYVHHKSILGAYQMYRSACRSHDIFNTWGTHDKIKEHSRKVKNSTRN